jgi:hypothetical protein
MEKDKKTEAVRPPKTFKDLGLNFDPGSGCNTCMDESCHNQVTRKSDGNEYSVHISTNGARSLFKVYASESANNDSDSDIDEEFDVEEEAVKFVCSTFNGFKCF